jgi:hypothetical protein
MRLSAIGGAPEIASTGGASGAFDAQPKTATVPARAKIAAAEETALEKYFSKPVTRRLNNLFVALIIGY